MATVSLESMNRRDWMKWSGAAAAAAAASQSLFCSSSNAADVVSIPGMKLGVQSYSLRHFKVGEALEHTKKLGLKYWEAYPGHVPVTAVPMQRSEQLEMLNGAGVTLAAFGVVPFNEKEAQARAYFDYAKAMNIKSISADPVNNKETFDLLDKLVAEYDIAVAIHNHGPKHRYNKISDVLNMVKDRHPKIGACVDTGHYLRSDESPVEAIEKFGARTFGVHLKDVKTVENNGKRDKQFKILGEGDLDVTGCLKALKALNYQYVVAIEYEENKENPLPDLEVCLQHIRNCAAKL